MPLIRANGINTYYEEAGSGKPLVLLHNDAMSLEVWRRLRPHLQQDHRLIAYDRRGHGKSETPPREARYTVEGLAEDLRALLDGLEIGLLEKRFLKRSLEPSADWTAKVESSFRESANS